MDSEKDERQIISGVRIVTTEGLIFQGQLVPPPVPLLLPLPFQDNQFLFLRLTCQPEILFNGTREDIQPPLFFEGITIKINSSQIIAIGPSGDCLTDATA